MKDKSFDLSAEHHSVQKSSTKQGILGFSAKKAPVFVYHETKSSSKIRVNPRRESSPQHSSSSQGLKKGNKRGLDVLQPTSALTKATADGYCQLQDEINTVDDTDLRDRRKRAEGNGDRYFDDGSIRFGLFCKDFDEDDNNRKDRSANIVQKINFFGRECQDDQDCELRSQKNSTYDELEASIVEAV